MEKKVIFFDVAGTIINGDYMFPRIKDTLNKLKEQSHLLVLSTGRTVPIMGDALKDMEFEDIISSAGNVTMSDNEIIFNHALSNEELNERK